MKKNVILYLFVIALVMGSCGTSSTGNKAVNETAGKTGLLNPQEFQDKMAALDKVQLVDVRTPEEYNGGYITGAVNMDFNNEAFEEQIKELKKDVPVMVYCKAGGRSEQAAALLAEKGFKEVYDLKGGMMAWERQDFPIATGGISMTDPNKYTAAFLKEITASNQYMVIDFYAPWCGPCKRMEPALEKLSKDYQGKVVVTRINVDEANDLSEELEIESIPVILTYKNGKLWQRANGEQSEEKLRELFVDLTK